MCEVSMNRRSMISVIGVGLRTCGVSMNRRSMISVIGVGLYVKYQ